MEADAMKQNPKRLIWIVGIAFLLVIAVVAGWYGVNAVRNAAAQTQSLSNVGQMAKATHNFASTTQTSDTLPMSTFDSHGRPMHSWLTKIIPQLESTSIFEMIDLSRPWDDPVNAVPMARHLRMFHAPDQPDTPVNGRGVTHYAGNVHLFVSDSPTRLANLPNGGSNTILIGEASTNHRAWSDPLNVRDPRLDINRHPDGYGGPNRRKPAFAMADGSTRTFDPAVFQEYLEMFPQEPRR